MKGIPTYTQHTVAFPTVSFHRHGVFEELYISFDAFGGGTHGEFALRWVKFTQPESIALRIDVFTDGLSAMLDARIMGVIQALARRQRSLAEWTPEQVIGLLEAAGVRPSTHHLRGLLERGGSHTDTMRWKRELEKLRRHERGRERSVA